MRQASYLPFRHIGLQGLVQTLATPERMERRFISMVAHVLRLSRMGGESAHF